MFIKNLFNTIEYFFKYFIILIPIALIIGPAPTDTITSLLAFYIVIRSIYYKDFSYFNNIYFKIIIIFCIFLIINSLISDYTMLSLESSLFYVRFILYSIALAYFFDKYETIFNLFFISIIFCVIFVSLDGFFQYIFGINFFGFTSMHNGRISGVFRDELILGSFISRLVPLCFFYISLKYSNSKVIIISAIISIILFDILIYLSGERSAFIYLFLTTIIIIFLTQKFRMLRLLTFLVSLIIIIAISLVNPDSKYRMIDHTLNQINFGEINNENIELQKKGLLIFSEEHNDHYKTAFNMFKDKPLIGHGPKSFREVCKFKEYKTTWGCSTHPHNSYIQLLSETGIIGFLPVCFLLFYLIYKMLMQFISLYIYKQNINLLSDERIYIYLALLISLWPIIPTGNFFGNWINAIYFIPFAILIRKNE